MGLIIQNVSGATIDVNDLGFGLENNGTMDLTLESDAIAVAQSGAGGSLQTLISAGDVVVKDPLDDLTNLSISDGLVAVRTHNDTHFRMPPGARIGDISNVDLTGLTTGQVLSFDGSNWTPETPVDSSNAFSIIAVPAGGSLVADVVSDTLTIAQPTAGITIVGTPGTDTITFALADDLLAVENLATTGLATRTAANTWVTRTITQSPLEDQLGIQITNGDGVSANPIVGFNIDGIPSSPSNLAATDEIPVHDKSEGTGGANRTMTGQQIADGIGTLINLPSADLSSVTVGLNADVAIPLTYTDVNWQNTHVENNAAVIEHDNTLVDRILIKESGLYFIAYSLSFDADAGEETISARVRIDDTTVVPGSLRTASEDDEVNDLSNTITAELVAGQYISLQAIASGAGNTLESSSTFMVTRARGVQGAVGPTGAGSNISLKDEGIAVAGGPHSILNFAGPGVVVTNAGAGEATITIDGVQQHFFGHNNTVTQTFTALTTINFSTVPRGDAAFTTNVDVGGTSITINTSGWYEITYEVSATTTTGSRGTSRGEVQVNGTLVPGSRAFAYHRNTASGEGTATATVKVNLTATDVVRVRHQVISGNAVVTLAQGCRLNIQSIDGP